MGNDASLNSATNAIKEFSSIKELEFKFPVDSTIDQKKKIISDTLQSIRALIEQSTTSFPAYVDTIYNQIFTIEQKLSVMTSEYRKNLYEKIEKAKKKESQERLLLTGIKTDAATIAKIEERYRKLLKKAQNSKNTFAAGNLEYYLEGKGGIRFIDSKVLRKFGMIQRAERENQMRFEEKGPPQGKGKLFVDTIIKMKSGQSMVVSDKWDFVIKEIGGIKKDQDLFYASNMSELTSIGMFTLKKNSNVTTVDGIVEHIWHDVYDWHPDPNLNVEIPFFGRIEDYNAWLLEKYGKASFFKMESTWKQSLKGTIRTINNKFEKDFRWTDV